MPTQTSESDEVLLALKKEQRELQNAVGERNGNVIKQMMEASLRYEALADLAYTARATQQAAREREKALDDVETEVRLISARNFTLQLEGLYQKFRRLSQGKVSLRPVLL